MSRKDANPLDKAVRDMKRGRFEAKELCQEVKAVSKDARVRHLSRERH
ncbi:MAG: hypothetical protein HY924_16370 [Elusimicrobia bacterium]|nr:hypothetical protein [Elusimicrobiota bacterium]